MAALWNLPVLFICENNHYGALTAGHAQQAAHTLLARQQFSLLVSMPPSA